MSYSVTLDSSRKTSPWVLTVPKSVAGKRVRRFFSHESDAWMEGGRLMSQLKERGTISLEEDSSGITVERAVALFDAQYVDYSKSHREKVEKVTRWIAEGMPGQLKGITPMRCVEWFKRVEGVSTSRATIYRYARMFFNWCVKTDMLDKSPWRAVVCPDSSPGRNILTPEQMRAALADEEIPDYLRAAIMLGGFAGLRTVEVRRLRWEDIDRGQIYIGPEVAKQKKKGNRERLVDMTEPLKRRAKLFKGRTGLVVPVCEAAFYRERRKLAERLCGWDDFPTNSLRHSFATYHLGQCNNPALTAYQMGTSTQLVIATYAVPARRADWKAWWRI